MTHDRQARLERLCSRHPEKAFGPVTIVYFPDRRLYFDSKEAIQQYFHANRQALIDRYGAYSPTWPYARDIAMTASGFRRIPEEMKP